MGKIETKLSEKEHDLFLKNAYFCTQIKKTHR